MSAVSEYLIVTYEMKLSEAACLIFEGRLFQRTTPLYYS